MKIVTSLMILLILIIIAALYLSITSSIYLIGNPHKTNEMDGQTEISILNNWSDQDIDIDSIYVSSLFRFDYAWEAPSCFLGIFDTAKVATEVKQNKY